MQKRPHLIPALIATAMLLGATVKLPYEYYQALRWIVCGIAIYVAYKAYGWEAKWATWLFGIIAVLFNPIVPVHLTREIWQPIDFACATLFGLSIPLLKEPVQEVPSDTPEQQEKTTLVKPPSKKGRRPE